MAMDASRLRVDSYPAQKPVAPGRLRDVCLFEGDAVGDAGISVRVELSSDAHRVMQRISKGSELGAFVVAFAATCLLVGRYTKRPVVALDIPPSVATAAKRPGSSDHDPVTVTIALERLESFKDLLLECQRRIADSKRTIQPGFATGSDVLVLPSAVDERTTAAARHDLCVRVALGALVLESPSGRFPEWFLADLGARLDDAIGTLGDLSRPLGAIEDAMRRRSLAQASVFNRTTRSVPESATVLDVIREHVRTRPTAAAVVCGSDVLSYAELDRRANELGDRLRAACLGDARTRPPVIAALNARSSWAIVALLGILKAGAVYLPLARKTPAARVQRMLEESGAAGLVVESAVLEELGTAHGVPRVVVDAVGPALAAERPPIVGPADAAYIIYTSGTTGVPKGVEIAHGGLLNTALEHIARFRVTEADRYLQFMALSFDGFLLDVFTTLCAGATLVIADEETIADPERLERCITEQRICLSTMTPSYLRLLKPECLGFLRVLVSAGEVLDGDLARTLASRLELYNGYGPTEATINSTLHRVPPTRCTPPITIGRPSANKQLYVVDDRLEPQPLGVVGELCIGGMGLARRYVGDEASTRAKFVENPFGDGRLYRTGDYGAWGHDGRLVFQGRADSQVKHRGYRIDLLEIKAALTAHPNVRLAEVLLLQSSGAPELVAFFQPRGPAGLEDDIDRHLTATLPEYMRPGRLVAVERWPLTPHGKTDGAALARCASKETRPCLPSRAPTATEQLLCDLWRDVLGLAQVPLDVSFVALGGDSLRLIQAVHRARRHGLNLQVGDIVALGTIARIAEHLDRARRIPSDRSGGGDAVPLELATLSRADRERLPRDIEDAYPASRMQSFMIERYANDEGNGIYLGCAEWQFSDPALCEESMCEAVARLRARHRSLRLTFVRRAGLGDILLVAPTSHEPIEREDLRALSKAEQEAFFWREIERETGTRFDAYSGMPLIRFRLYRTGDDRCSLFLSFHHAILDGWSGIELRNALLEYYLDAKAGRPSRAPAQRDEPDSYREFVALECAVQKEPAARAFWESRIASDDARAALAGFEHALSGRRTGPPRHSTLDGALPTEVVLAARSRSTRAGTSLKAIFLSSVAAAILDALDLETLVLGVITNGRSARLTEPFRSTGLFWNIVPLLVSRADLAPTSMQRKLDELTAFGHFPWKAIEEEIARRELFVPIFNFVNFHNAGEGARRFTEGVVQSRFHTPLTFFIKVDESGSKPSAMLRLGFDGAVFGRALAETMRQRVSDEILAPEDR